MRITETPWIYSQKRVMFRRTRVYMKTTATCIQFAFLPPILIIAVSGKQKRTIIHVNYYTNLTMTVRFDDRYPQVRTAILS